MGPTDALAVATALIDDLDRNDAEAVEQWFAPGATWWVDTGCDRAAGEFGHDPGDDRPWPLHGAMDAAAKARMLRGLPTRFPNGCRQQRRRGFAGGPLAVLEVAGDGEFITGRRYQNRYAFVIEVVHGRVLELREYLDTAHAADVFEGTGVDRITIAPAPAEPQLEPAGRDGELALRFIAALDAASPAEVLAVCTPDATWWADGGRTRTAGPEAPIEPGGNPAKGKMPIADRAPLVGQLASLFPDGLRVVAQRLVESDGGGLVAVEARGHGVHQSGITYQNRYCFVLRTAVDGIAEIREYCDTHHGFDVLRRPAAD
jgi:ketosteroid isomerase-like protein